jgi:DNA-binding HxlR family transcriptional regulator
MGDGFWKLSVDQKGVTIASDRFSLTTANSADGEAPVGDGNFAVAANQIDAIVAELEAMNNRGYGQYCGLARAMELVGERWTMLIVRDLSVGPKTAADLRQGLPRIPAETLTGRLRSLERSEIIRRRPIGDASGYELTQYGAELEDILLRLSRWGAAKLGDLRPEEIITTDSVIVAIRSVFVPDAARGIRASYVIRVSEGIVVHVKVVDGNAHVGEGEVANPDLVLEPGFVLKELMSGEISAADALANGYVKIVGDPELLIRFTEMFAIPPVPAEVG